MRAKRIITTVVLGSALALIAVFVMLYEPERAQAAPPGLTYPAWIAPSLTDGPQNDGSDPCNGQIGPGIGCDAADQWGDSANNESHILLLPPTITVEGKLLVFLCGGKGRADFCRNVYPVAAEQGYHVIGLTYPVELDSCSELPAAEKRACFGDVMFETVTGDEHSTRTNFQMHRQDSIVNRLVNVLKWARIKQNPGDGWERFLTPDDTVNWSKVNLAGFSNGSSHASFMGTKPRFENIGRVALFSGPNDGTGSSEDTWHSSDYIHKVEGMTDTRYYGLVHVLNKAVSDDPADNVLFKVTKNWEKFGMEGRRDFDPFPGIVQNFGNAHMLISTDEPTTFVESHNSAIKDAYCTEYADPDDPEKCTNYGLAIGYRTAWQCILGTGDRYASRRPFSDAGPSQTVECQGDGGANVDLDGSGSTDLDCDVLAYAWSGPFGAETGRNPNVFCPVGSNLITLVASDDWWSSLLPSTTVVNVVDTQAPSLSVTLTPTVLWSPNHQLVRIDATVTAADSCAAPQVVLTSVTSNQPDNGVADGDTTNDIQGVEADTFDTSFFVRAERAGNDPNGRTYTVVYTATDVGGNQTEARATVHVPQG